MLYKKFIYVRDFRLKCVVLMQVLLVVQGFVCYV